MYPNFSRVNSTAGIFWYNTADTWVDIDKVEGSSTGYNTYFMSETGSLDAFLFLGPTFYQVTQQYAIVTGKAPLPPVSMMRSYQNLARLLRQYIMSLIFLR